MSLQFLLTAFFHVLVRHKIVQFVTAKYLEIMSNSYGNKTGDHDFFCFENSLVEKELKCRTSSYCIAISEGAGSEFPSS